MQALLAWRDLLECLSFLAIILGVPVAIYQYYRAARKEQLDREYGTYNALDEKYLDFLSMCFDNPRLDVFDVRDEYPRDLSQDEEKQEVIAFTILISLFERAFLMYSDQSTEIKARQWTGWQEYIYEFCGRPNFRRAWRISGDTFDSEFEAFIKAELGRLENDPHPSASTLTGADQDVSGETLNQRNEAKYRVEPSEPGGLRQRAGEPHDKRRQDVKSSDDDDLEP